MTGTAVIAGILLLGLGTFAMKAVGPVLVGGGRPVPSWLPAVGTVLPAALLSALVAVDLAAAPGDRARLVGAAVAAVAVIVRAPFVVIVVGAALVTALLRAAGL